MKAVDRVRLIAQKCEDGKKPKTLMIGGKEHTYVYQYRLSHSDIEALRILCRQYEKAVGGKAS